MAPPLSSAGGLPPYSNRHQQYKSRHSSDLDSQHMQRPRTSPSTPSKHRLTQWPSLLSPRPGQPARWYHLVAVLVALFCISWIIGHLAATPSISSRITSPLSAAAVRFASPAIQPSYLPHSSNERTTQYHNYKHQLDIDANNDEHALLPNIAAASNSTVHQWLSLHSAAAVAVDSDNNVCSARKYVTVHCCNGNFGTSFMRILAVVKLGVQLNRTVLLDASHEHPRGGEVEWSYIQWQLPTENEIRARLQRTGCLNELFHTPQYELPNPTETSIDLPYEWKLLPTLMSNDTTLCPGLVIDGTPGEWYKHMRCSDVVSEHSNIIKRVARVGEFDLWDWHHLLEYNPHWLQSPQRALFGYELDKVYHQELFDAIVKPSAALQSIIDTFVNTDAIPQQTQKVYGTGWTGAVHFRTDWPVQNDPATLVAVRELIKELAPYNFSRTLLPAKLPLFVSSARLPSYDVCRIILNNLTIALTHLKPTNTKQYGQREKVMGSDLVDCRYFDAQRYIQQHSPLPPGISMQSVNYQPHDWGVEPSWAAVVNLFAVAQTRGFLVGLEESSFAAVMRLTSKLESWGFDGTLNSHKRYWPF